MRGETPDSDFDSNFEILSEECREEVIDALVNGNEPIDIYSQE